MAFTLSHAAVAPLLHRLSRQQLPLAALVFGSMSPDLLRLFGVMSYFGHTWTGVITIDLVVGVVCCVLWHFVYRPLVYALFGRNALADSAYQFQDLQPVRRPWEDVALAYLLAVGIGAVTHLIWDGFTHNDFRRFTWSAEFLQQTVQIPLLSAPMPLYHLLQYVTSVLAVPFLWGLVTPVLMAPRWQRSSPGRFAWVSLLLAFAAGAAAVVWRYPALYELLQASTYQALGHASFAFSRGFVAVLTVAAILFRLIFCRRD